MTGDGAGAALLVAGPPRHFASQTVAADTGTEVLGHAAGGPREFSFSAEEKKSHGTWSAG
jgi:hypothetical protein